MPLKSTTKVLLVPRHCTVMVNVLHSTKEYTWMEGVDHDRNVLDSIKKRTNLRRKSLHRDMDVLLSIMEKYLIQHHVPPNDAQEIPKRPSTDLRGLTDCCVVSTMCTTLASHQNVHTRNLSAYACKNNFFKATPKIYLLTTIEG